MKTTMITRTELKCMDIELDDDCGNDYSGNGDGDDADDIGDKDE